jgi:hypothetical protein
MENHMISLVWEYNSRSPCRREWTVVNGDWEVGGVDGVRRRNGFQIQLRGNNFGYHTQCDHNWVTVV